MMKKIKTPFRYPGSKSSFTNVVKQFLIYNNMQGCELVEPYAGSSAVTLALLSENICSKATIGERDPLLYSFWKVVFSSPDKLLKKIEDVEVTLDTWHTLRPLLKVEHPDDYDELELAFAAIFLNRTNFSGVMHSGPIGGQSQMSDYKIDCRFNKETLINQIQRITSLTGRVNVRFGDALNIIKEYKRRTKPFFYIDPPYFIQGPNLYRHNYKLRDHVNLSKALTSAKFKWLLSYDSHDVIKSLYDEHNHVLTPFQYSTRKPKNEHELLITNLKMPDDGD